MAHPLMPKATAVWLVDNTTLTFDQVAEFCGLHILEVQAIADDEVAVGMQGLDPITGGELTQEEIDRCQADPSAKIQLAVPDIPMPKARQKGARYTPVSKRGDRPNAIAWLIRNYAELSDGQISKLIGTTKPTINSVRDRSHWNTPNIKPQNPVGLGLCSGTDLEKAVALARARAGTVHTPGAATAPDGIHPKQAQPVSTPPEGDTAEGAAAPDAAVFGDAPAPDSVAETPAADPVADAPAAAEPVPAPAEGTMADIWPTDRS